MNSNVVYLCINLEKNFHCYYPHLERLTLLYYNTNRVIKGNCTVIRTYVLRIKTNAITINVIMCPH